MEAAEINATSQINISKSLNEMITAGKKLNTNMKHKEAIQCFTNALSNIKAKYSYCSKEIDDMKERRSKEFEEDVINYCEAITCAVETYLHLDLSIYAKDILSTYHYRVVFNISERESGIDVLTWTSGTLLLNLGIEFINKHSLAAGKTILEDSRSDLLQFEMHPEAQPKKAELFSTLGFCYLCLLMYDNAEDVLLDAIDLWRKLKYPFYQIDTIICAMKSYIEVKLKGQQPYIDQHNVCTDMIQLHKALISNNIKSTVPEAFIELGKTAFQNEKEKSALAFFEEALNLYRKAPCPEQHYDKIPRLLRDVGVASYNCRDFHKAARSYKECLQMIEQGAPLSGSKLIQVAECYAALGFTFSRLRNFEKMLEYYQNSLQLKNYLAPEDLELIETNIGSLYHVQSVLCEKKGDIINARIYGDLALNAFRTSLKYSWKSFPYISYGYYLLFRQENMQAIQVLQQGYLNGVVDQDTIEFDHTEDPILIDDIKRELEGCEEIRIPSAIVALYLKVLAQRNFGDIVGARDTVNHLKHELQVCKFENYYTEDFGLSRMKALCQSLLGYAYGYIDMKTESRAQFIKALDFMPEYVPAIKNLADMS